jgi:hypothetical protein
MLDARMFPQIAALLAQRQGQQPPSMQPPMVLSAGQAPAPTQAKPPAYYGSIPEIAKAREADPRQLLANTAMGNGVSTAPVAGGKWAWVDGIARALSGVAGGYMNKENDKRYAKREQDVVAALKASATLANTPSAGTPPIAPPASPQQTPPPTPSHLGQRTIVPQAPQIAAALGGPPPPAQDGQSFADAFAPFGATPPAAQNDPSGGPVAAPGLSPTPTPPRTALAAPTPAPTPAPEVSPRGSLDAQGGKYSASELYFKGIAPIEGGTDKNGRFLTSPKGAIGPGQVMPGTAPEAARLAGVPFDDYKYRNDANYNNLLGQAYYAEQLKTFGDPVKAAAAYNAGPGRVTRALRRAERSGADWTTYLPEETQKYVQSFKAKVGDEGEAGASRPAGVVGAGSVNAPKYEQVRELGPANYVPPEVESNRIRMAQQMLESGNPDMVAMAREYLDKGLSEQSTARLQRNAQQFNMGAGERDLEFQDRTNTQSRNFGREEIYSNQTFTSRENALGREQQVALANADRKFTREERIASESFAAKQARLDREARKAEFEASMEKNPFFDTIGGRKLADDMYATIDNNSLAVSKYDRLLQILDSGMQTGSMYAGYGADELQQRFGGLNSDVGEFLALSTDTTLAKIGGSLGVAISDGDRSFIANSNVNLGKDEQANRNIALATIGALERKTDYTYARMQAEMGGPEALKAFNSNWRAFAEASPIVQYDGKGNVSKVTRTPMKFDEWVASRPKFDANGNRIPD